jgi:hypothetical protein
MHNYNQTFQSSILSAIASSYLRVLKLCEQFLPEFYVIVLELIIVDHQQLYLNISRLANVSYNIIYSNDTGTNISLDLVIKRKIIY